MIKLKDGYYAKDADNNIYYYDDTKPFKKSVTWNCIDDKEECAYHIEITEPWEDSLYYIKDGVATKVVTFTKDQKVLVRDQDHHSWIKRYYSHESNGIHNVFINGQTSWTSPDTCRFNYIKPYEESNVNNEEA